MSKSVVIYGGLLLLSLAGAWMQYTGEESTAREGVVLVDAKKDDLERMTYTAPDAEIVYEVRKDDVGTYAWVTVTEQKKKREGGADVPYTKVTKFKAGAAADKLVESVAPVMALRDLDKPDDAKLETFGLSSPDTTFTITTGGRTLTLSLGGETYGTKDRYVRDVATGKVYVVDDDLFKPLKFANSRLPERSLFSFKREEIDSVTLGQGASTVTWTQKNRDDKAAAYFDRPVGAAAATGTDANPAASSGGKDETFANWFDTWSKLKSTAFVQEADVPTDLVTAYEITVRGTGKADEIVTFLISGEEWFARSNFTRGLVKLSRGTAKDSADEVDDILEGRVPPAKPKSPRSDPHGGPPGMAPAGADDHGGPGGHSPMPGMPGMPARPPGAPAAP